LRGRRSLLLRERRDRAEKKNRGNPCSVFDHAAPRLANRGRRGQQTEGADDAAGDGVEASESRALYRLLEWGWQEREDELEV
jgi:hypothetical protein